MESRGVVWLVGEWGGEVGFIGRARVDSVLDFASGNFFQFWKIPPAFCIKIHG